jgi:NAD kinase
MNVQINIFMIAKGELGLLKNPHVEANIQRMQDKISNDTHIIIRKYKMCLTKSI